MSSSFAGLNGVPVCVVNDEWSEQTIFPPHPMIKSQPRTSVWGVPAIQMPIGDPQPIPIPRLSVGKHSICMLYSAIGRVG